MKFDVPILFLTFNRTKQTQRVFDTIRQIQPTKLYFAADGARENREGESKVCEKVRSIVLENIDWDCTVKTLLRDKNLGCRKAVSSAITWFFEHEPEGIILEDDCLPDLTFFAFCSELLEKYRFDNRIMMISGINHQKKKTRCDYSYYFTRYNQIWGWASWRRVWDLYDEKMALLPEILENGYLNDIFQDKVAAQKWSKDLSQVYAGKRDTWDYQFSLTCLIHGGLCINPKANLVSNIGFDENATHTAVGSIQTANLPTFPMQFPLVHPPYMIRDAEADYYDEKNDFHPNLFVKAKFKIKGLLKIR
jgi:hypothetical protein